MTRGIDCALGCRMPIDNWVRLNRDDVFREPALRTCIGLEPRK